MKSKALAVSSIPAMTEKRVQGCQLSGHCCSGGGDLMPKLLFLICVLGKAFFTKARLAFA
jgi:hypothetical protein